ncbi:MAG: hypothetical protein WC483_05665, partial [Candidatus Paceibacterota bacterium]
MSAPPLISKPSEVWHQRRRGPANGGKPFRRTPRTQDRRPRRSGEASAAPDAPGARPATVFHQRGRGPANGGTGRASGFFPPFLCQDKEMGPGSGAWKAP